MSTQQTKAFLFMEFGSDYESGDYEQKWRPALWKCKVDENESRIFVKEMTVTVEVPDDFDPTGRQIAALEKNREELQRQFARAIAEVNERISKLQAITYEPA